MSDKDTRTTSLTMSPDEFRRAGHALVDRVADLLATLRERPVTRGDGPDAVRAAVDAGAPLPEEGADARTLLRTTAELLFERSLFNGHPRFFGYITSSPAPIGILGDLLASAVNPNVGGWRLAPAATEMEAQAVRWIAELVGYPTDCGGLMVSGGNVANAVGLMAARVAAADWDIRKQGNRASAARPLRVYASAETHTWVEKATDLSGLGTDSVRWISTDGHQRMDLEELRAALERDRAAGDLPMAVVGTAGSVSTGAVDPLDRIADLCREEGIWFHVDGAYGGFAAALHDEPGELIPPDLPALGRADSVALDPHKWLYAPLEAGCVLVRHADALRAAYSYHPPYYHFQQEAINYHDFGPQNSRGFRALKVWLALRQAGRRGYVQSIGDDIRLSRRLHGLLRDHPAFEPLTRELSITTFRYVPEDLWGERGTDAVAAYLDRLNERLLDRIQCSGEAFVSNAVLGGRYVLRTCIVNLNTTRADVDALPGILERLGRQVDRELRREAPERGSGQARP